MFNSLPDCLSPRLESSVRHVWFSLRRDTQLPRHAAGPQAIDWFIGLAGCAESTNGEAQLP